MNESTRVRSSIYEGESAHSAQQVSTDKDVYGESIYEERSTIVLVVSYTSRKPAGCQVLASNTKKNLYDEATTAAYIEDETMKLKFLHYRKGGSRISIYSVGIRILCYIKGSLFFDGWITLFTRSDQLYMAVDETTVNSRNGYKKEFKPVPIIHTEERSEYETDIIPCVVRGTEAPMSYAETEFD